MRFDSPDEKFDDEPARLPRRARLTALLRKKIWPELPDNIRRQPLTKEEKEKLLGYGPQGY
jgi:antitoxin VapB